jgi:hypothetical protein
MTRRDRSASPNVDHFARFIRTTKAPARDSELTSSAVAKNGYGLFDKIGCATYRVEIREPLRASSCGPETDLCGERLSWSGRRLCPFSAKDARRKREFAVPDLLPDVSKQQVAGLRQTATQVLQLGGVSILSPLSGSLN